jgi:5-(carboxyamino)imidazole ribonucleotide synthase
MEKNSSRSRFDVGIVGAGQLARMMIEAAIPLDLRLRLLAQSPADGAAIVWPDVVIGSPDDPAAVVDFARLCDVVTFDHELVAPESLSALVDNDVVIRPSAATLEFAQNKLWQRRSFAEHGFPVPPFARVSSSSEIESFAATDGWPVAFKTAKGGYDGRGVWRIEDANEAASVFDSLGGRTTDILVERWIPIDREIAVMVARSPSGQIATYPVVDTLQVEGICREIVAPADVPSEIADRAEQLARSIARTIGLTGVMAVEYFVSGNDVLINEIATRPHNSGHYTIEGCVTSQFEQHLRAVMDLPLGDTSLRSDAVVTVNVLGGSTGEDPKHGLAAALAIEGVHIHLYGKEARRGRKLGHVTVTGFELDDIRRRAWQAAELLAGEPAGVVR